MRINLREINLYVISLKTAQDRRDHINQEFAKYGLTPIMIDAVKDNIGLIGCAKSHSKALTLSFKNKPFAIFEDDITINSDSPMEFDIPDNTDAVYLGMSNYYDQGLPNKNGPSFFPLNDLYGKITNMLSGHGILYINPLYVKHTLEMCKFSVKTIQAHDIYLSMTQEFFNVLAFVQPIVYQDGSFGGQEKQTRDTLIKFIKPSFPAEKDTICQDIAIVISIANIDSIDSYINILRILELSYFLIIFCHCDMEKYIAELRLEKNTKIIITNDIRNFLKISSTNDIEPYAVKYAKDNTYHKHLLWIAVGDTQWIKMINELPNYVSQYPDKIHFFCRDGEWSKRLVVFNANLPISATFRSYVENETIKVWFLALDPNNAINTIRKIRFDAEKTRDSEKWRITELMCKQIVVDHWEQTTGKNLVAVFIEWILASFYNDNCNNFSQLRHYFNKLYSIHKEFYVNIQGEQLLQNNLLFIGGPAFLPNLCLSQDAADIDLDLEYYTNKATIFVEIRDHPSGIIRYAQKLFRKVHCIERSQNAFCEATKMSPNIQIGYHDNITIYRGDPKEILPTILTTIDDNVIFFLSKEHVQLLSEIDEHSSIKSIIMCEGDTKQEIKRCKITEEHVHNDHTVFHIEPPDIINYGILIFSKDRPLQLTALLDSLSIYINKLQSINILYLASTETSQKCYDQLIKSYPQYTFIKECDFYTQVLNIISIYTYIVFLVDDSLLVRKCSISNCIDLLECNTDILGVSLRLGENTTHCFNMNTENPIPPTKVTDPFLLYDWETAVGADFAYSMEISSSLYRSRDILTLVKSKSFTKPNDFEDVLSQNKKTLHRPLLAMYKISRAFSIPYNMVQETHSNRGGNDVQTSTENLLFLYDLGVRINVSKYHHYVPSACHELVELHLIPANNVT